MKLGGVIRVIYLLLVTTVYRISSDSEGPIHVRSSDLGRPGYALDFQGPGSGNWLLLPGLENLDKEFTFEMWIHPCKSSYSATLLSLRSRVGEYNE